MTIEEATFEALSLRRSLWRRRADIIKSRDFIFGAAIGTLLLAASFFPRSNAPSYLFTMIVSTFAIVGGFQGASLSILIGFIAKPVAEADRLQFLNIVADYCFSVGVVLFAALCWIVYAAFISLDHVRSDPLRIGARVFLIYISSYAAAVPFTAIARLFRLAGIASIAEEKAANRD